MEYIRAAADAHARYTLKSAYYAKDPNSVIYSSGDEILVNNFGCCDVIFHSPEEPAIPGATTRTNRFFGGFVVIVTMYIRARYDGPDLYGTSTKAVDSCLNVLDNAEVVEPPAPSRNIGIHWTKNKPSVDRK